MVTRRITDDSIEQLADVVGKAIRVFGEEDLATLLNISVSTLHRWEKGIARPAPRVRAYVIKTLADKLSQAAS